MQVIWVQNKQKKKQLDDETERESGYMVDAVQFSPLCVHIHYTLAF